LIILLTLDCDWSILTTTTTYDYAIVESVLIKIPLTTPFRCDFITFH